MHVFLNFYNGAHVLVARNSDRHFKDKRIMSYGAQAAEAESHKHQDRELITKLDI
jgi:hypothetical protein